MQGEAEKRWRGQSGGSTIFGSIAFPLFDIGQKSERRRIFDQLLLLKQLPVVNYKLAPRTREAIPFGILNWTTGLLTQD